MRISRVQRPKAHVAQIPNIFRQETAAIRLIQVFGLFRDFGESAQRGLWGKTEVKT